MKVEEYFRSYPGSNACYQSADGLIFHQEGDARLHAKSLDEKEVQAFARKKEAAPVEEVAEDIAEPAKPKAKRASK